MYFIKDANDSGTDETLNISKPNMIQMLCDECKKAKEISEDRFQTKEFHDKCKVLIDVNGQRERCGCDCQLNTIPPLNVVAELEGEDAEAFSRYNERDLDSSEEQSLNDSINLYRSKKSRK